MGHPAGDGDFRSAAEAPGVRGGASMIGQLSSVVIDCRDQHGLAHFYSELLGLPVTRVDGDWVDIGDGQTRLSFMQANGHQPQRWPTPAYPPQVHLYLRVA